MRTMDPVLREGLERANPVVCDIVEITAPDSTKILRRANDQFFTTPPRVSETPAATTAADANGALILAPTDTQIASFYTENSHVGFGDKVDPSTIIKGVGWTIDPAYGRVVLKKFTARIRRNNTTPLDLALHIYRPKLQRRYERVGAGDVAKTTAMTFVEVLPEPVLVRYATLVWTADHADVVFDLSHIRPEVAPGYLVDDDFFPEPLVSNPHYIFQINPVNPPKGGILDWRIDQTTPIDVAGVGTFQEIAWQRLPIHTHDSRLWFVTKQNYCECFKLEIEQYPATSQLVYALDLPRVPIADSVGRAVFERSTPPGTAAQLELSTAGSGGPWTIVKHGDPVATKQLTYHARVTLNASAALRQTPRVTAFGLDFRVPIDVSAEATIESVAHEVQMPFCQAGIGEGRCTIVRAGRRDYRDIAADLAIGYPTSKLELDHYIGSRHPKIPRDRWFHFDRSPVTNREPTEAAETFSLLSPLKALKRKIPARVETINTIHTVSSATTGQVVVAPNISGAAGTGDYLGLGYYMRVRTSTQVGVSSGFIQTIDNNTNLDTINFTTPLPGTLVAGNVIEIHSAQYEQPVIQWADADPADVWWEIFTTHLGIPSEQLGFAGEGQASRSGLPPRVTDRAPGDVLTQEKLKVTLLLASEEDADELIDQLSFIMGGCTVAIGGQFVFRQIYPLRDANDRITIPTARPQKAFDARDYAGLQTSTGLEQRITQLSCDYGVNTTLVSDETQAASTAVFVDADALAYLAPQDVEGLGRATIAKSIARWCFNTADNGLFLATQLNKQVVRVAATGLRVWPFTTVDAHPDLHVGDAVTLVTDQYTDYDPTRKMEIRGLWAYSVIIVSVQAGGRRFRALLPGLGSASPIRGGAGTLTPPPVPAAGGPPTALITHVSRTRTHETLELSGTLGGAGPLVWRLRENGLAPINWETSELPQPLVRERHLFWPIAIELQTRQADGQVTTSPVYMIPPKHEGLHELTGRRQRNVPNDDGFYDVAAGTDDGLTARDLVKDFTAREIRRLFAKPLSADPDNLDSAPDGTTYHRPLATRINSGRPLIDFSEVIHSNKNGEHIARSGVNATPLNNVTTHLQDTGHANDGMQEAGGKGINRLFAKPLAADPDNLDSAADGLTYARPLASRVSAGKPLIDFAEAIHANKHAENIARSPGDSTALLFVVQRMTNAGHAGSDMEESGGKAVNRLFAKPLAADSDNLDSATDGTTYKKVLAVTSGLITPGSSTGRFRCRVRIGTAYNIAHNTIVALSWDFEDFDIGGLGNAPATFSRLTVPSGGNVGAWLITATIVFANTSAVGERYVAIAKNGALGPALARHTVAAGPADTAITVCTIDSDPAVGDYYEAFGRQTSGGNLQIMTESRFSVVHLW